MFGFPRLQALIAEHGEETSLGVLLLEDLYSFVGESWEQEDDITILTLRRSAPPSRTSENSVHANFRGNVLYEVRGPVCNWACPRSSPYPHRRP
jgi:hypothetical protein